MRWWKVLGLAGIAGVAATGVVTVQAERRRRAYTPEEIRARLHERVGAGGAIEDDAAPPAPEPAQPTSTAGDGSGERGGFRGRLARLRGRR